MARPAQPFLDQLAAGFTAAGVGIGDEVLLAVSGGADSMALMYSTVNLWGTQSSSIVVGHVNHNLRGAESKQDLVFVENAASKLGVRFHSICLDSGQLKAKAKLTLEEAARDFRYDWLTKLALKLDVPSVVTAHHADDQAETVLHNIIRGTGLRGLGGMRSSRDLSDGCKLVRPMLGVERVDIEVFLDQLGCGFRVDQSNFESQFTRNKIRQQLLPLLRAEFNPQVVRNLNSLGCIADESAAYVEQVARELIAESMHYHDSASCRLDLVPFGNAAGVVVRQALVLLWTTLGWPRKKMTFRHWTQLADAVQGRADFEFDLPGFIRVECRGTLLRLTRKVAL